MVGLDQESLERVVLELLNRLELGLLDAYWEEIIGWVRVWTKYVTL